MKKSSQIIAFLYSPQSVIVYNLGWVVRPAVLLDASSLVPAMSSARHSGSDLQMAYNKLKESGKQSVDGIVQWLLDAKVINEDTEEKVRSYFANAVDKSNITAEKFKEAINELATDQKKSIEELSKILAENANSDFQDTYNKIRESGRNTVDGIVQWLQDAKVIDRAKDTEEKVRSYFANAVDKSNITAEKFKEAINELATDQKKSIEELSKILDKNATSDLQTAYNKLRESGKQSVDGIVQWLQDAKVIDGAKDTEEKVRSYFANSADKSNVTAEKFKEVIDEIASDQKTTVQELSKTLTEYGSQLLNKLQAAAQDIADAME